MKCDICNGEGFYFGSGEFVENIKHIIPVKLTCKKCQGQGTVNWVENIFGKKERGNKDIFEVLENIKDHMEKDS